MGKELTISQLTFVDLYDSYTLNLSSDVIAVPCNSDGEALSTAEYIIEYSVHAGEKDIISKCKSVSLSTAINGVSINSTINGKLAITIGATTEIPEDVGISIVIQTIDSNEFEFTRFISFMSVKNGKDGAPGEPGEPGMSGVGFKMHPDKGSVFKDGIEEITLSLELNVGGEKINEIVPYVWSYYDFEDNRWVLLGDENFTTYTAYSVSTDGNTAFFYNVGDLTAQDIHTVQVDGQARDDCEVLYAGSDVSLVVFDSPIPTNSTVVVITGGNSDYIENIFLTVSKTDPYAYSMFKCEITYNGETYADYETLMKDSQDIYTAETKILDDGNLADGNCAILYTKLYKNGKEIDPLLTTNIYFFNNLSIYTATSYDVGYFQTTDTQGLPKGENGDYAYFLVYKSMTYYQHEWDKSVGEYTYSNNYMYEKDDIVSGETYSSKTYADTHGANTYRLILAKHDGSYWRPHNPYDSYEYCYINDLADGLGNVTFLNSKIFAVNKKNLSMSQEININIYKKVYDNNVIPFKYYAPYTSSSANSFATIDIWKIYNYILNSDTYIAMVNSLAFQAIKTTYIEECFERKTDGVYVNQLITTVDATTGEKEEKKPFYVKIASGEIGFYENIYNETTGAATATKLVHIGNNSTKIKNSVLEEQTTVSGEASFKNNVNFENDVMFISNNGKFVLKFEDNGSLSLTT